MTLPVCPGRLMDPALFSFLFLNNIFNVETLKAWTTRHSCRDIVFMSVKMETVWSATLQ